MFVNESEAEFTTAYCRPTFKFGVKGSGRRMFLGNADKIRLRIWMHVAGMASHSVKWCSHRNSGKSWSSTCRHTAVAHHA